MQIETNHLPNAAAAAQAQAEADAKIAAALAERTKVRNASIEKVAEFGRNAAKGSVALMQTVAEYAKMVRAGHASDTVDDARMWYGAFAKGHNGAKLGDFAGHADALDANDSDAVSLLRTFVSTPVLAVTALMPDFYGKVLAVRKDIEADERVSTYQSCVRVNRAVRDWAGTADELTAALEVETFHGTVMGWLVPGKGKGKTVIERLNSVVDSWAKVAKREKSLTLDAVVDSMRGAVVAFAAELESKSDRSAKFKLETAALAGLGLTVDGQTIQ